jgi:hypothetical protein
MHGRTRAAAAALSVVAVLALAACGGGAGEEATEAPASVAAIPGSALKRVTLTEAAARRLGIETARVERSGAAGTAMPYAAVLYDLAGDTWAFTNPTGLVYVRAHIAVDRIDGKTAFLSAGPPAGTAVVTVGAAELLGAEIGVGEGE